MLHIVHNSLLLYEHNTIHFSLYYFVGIPHVDYELSTQDPEPTGMSMVQSLTFCHNILNYDESKEQNILNSIQTTCVLFYPLIY